MASHWIPTHNLTASDLTNIRHLMASKEAESLIKLLSATEEQEYSVLKHAKGALLFQAQGVAQFLEELDKIFNVKDDQGLAF